MKVSEKLILKNIIFFVKAINDNFKYGLTNHFYYFDQSISLSFWDLEILYRYFVLFNDYLICFFLDIIGFNPSKFLWIF